MRAAIHNAKRCTVENVDCWIGVIYEDASNRVRTQNLSPECDSQVDCIKWCKQEQARRGFPGAPITVDNNTNDPPKKETKNE